MTANNHRETRNDFVKSFFSKRVNFCFIFYKIYQKDIEYNLLSRSHFPLKFKYKC